MFFLKFVSQNKINSFSEDNSQYKFRYIFSDSSENSIESSKNLQRSLVVKIPGRIEVAWMSEEKEKGKVYDSDKVSFGIAINVIKKKISEKKTMVDEEVYIVNITDSFDFESEEFQGFHTNLVEI